MLTPVSHITHSAEICHKDLFTVRLAQVCMDGDALCSELIKKIVGFCPAKVFHIQKKNANQTRNMLVMYMAA